MVGEKRQVTTPKKTLLIKLVIAFVVPTISLFSFFAFFAYQVQRDALESELGRRLEDVASTAATRLKGKYLVDLEAGDERDSLHYTNGMGRLEQVRRATGVDRLYVFDREFLTRLDTSGLAIRERQFQAEIDREELRELFRTGRPTTSLLFDSLDGHPHKAGYAPLGNGDGSGGVELAIGVDAPADFFERLVELQKKLILYGLLLVFAVAVVAVLIGRRITKPIRSLAVAAQRIGSGDLRGRVSTDSNDEIGILAMTMENMRVALRNRDERMQLMLAGIAHEVRNPLGGIELYSGILREELENDGEKRSYVAKIDKEVGHLKVVVESFLDYARRPAPRLRPVALDLLLREIAELEEGLLSQLLVELKVDTVPTWCLADAQQIRRVILNLLRNAIQASAGSEAPVVVRTWEQGEWAGFSVSNFGAIITDEARSRLFEPFYTTKEKGTGLGLAFVDEIVRDHEGRIELTSNGESGTCFNIFLRSARPLPQFGESGAEGGDSEGAHDDAEHL